MKKTVWLNNAVGYNIYRVWSMFNRKIMKHSIPVDLPARKGLINREDFNNFVYKNLVGGVSIPCSTFWKHRSHNALYVVG